MLNNRIPVLSKALKHGFCLFLNALFGECKKIIPAMLLAVRSRVWVASMVPPGPKKQGRVACILPLLFWVARKTISRPHTGSELRNTSWMVGGGCSFIKKNVLALIYSFDFVKGIEVEMSN